jgi:DNA-binding beta-propeller fold protein YncE
VSALTYLCNPIGDIAVDPASGRLVTTHPRDCTVSILDGDDPASAAAIPLNGDPLAVAVTGGRAFVATTSASYDAVSVLDMDTKTISSVHPLAFTVTGIAVSPDGARLFAARTGRLGSDVAVVDLATAEITSIPVAARGASSIDVIRIGMTGHLYASLSSYGDGELVVIDSARRRVVTTLGVGAPIRDITLSPDGAVGYVLAHHPHGAAAVICIDLLRSEIGAVVDVSESATQVVMSPDGDEIYVVCRDGISVICASDQRVFKRIAISARPSCVATSSVTGQLYVADHAGNVTTLPAVTAVLQAAAG